MKRVLKLWDRILNIDERKGKPIGDGTRFEAGRAMSLEGSTPSPSANIPVDKYTQCYGKWHTEEQHLEMFCPHCGERGTPETLTVVDEIRREFFNWYELTYHRDADISNGRDFALWNSYKSGYFAGMQ